MRSFQIHSNFESVGFFEALREENERGVCFVYDYITAEYYLLVYGFSSMTKRCFGILINNNICWGVDIFFPLIKYLTWYHFCSFIHSWTGQFEMTRFFEVFSKRVVKKARKCGPIERFHMTSRPPYWCPKTMKRRPCWCPKPILWELKSFLMQTLSFVPINLHRWWPREWKRSIKRKKISWRASSTRNSPNPHKI